MDSVSPPQWRRLRTIRLKAIADSTDIYADRAAEISETSQYWQELMSTQHWAILQAAQQDRGLIAVYQTDDEKFGDCWIKSWWIDPNLRGQGAAKIMLDWVDQVCQALGWKVQALGVYESNQPAIKTFEKLGFKYAGIRNPTSRDPNEYYIVMFRELQID